MRAPLRKECRRHQSWPPATELFLESAGTHKTEADIRSINEPFSVPLHGDEAQAEVCILIRLVNFINDQIITHEGGKPRTFYNILSKLCHCTINY